MSTNLKDIVSDWGGFEEFVKEIHENDEVMVERDVTITGKSGAPRQIDVYLTHLKGPYKYTTLIECKYWNKKVERQQIENMYASMEDLNASKGVFFTTLGYQSGAETYAKSKNIDIYVIRDLTSKEWGRPGKIIEFYIQLLSKSILSIDCQETMVSTIEGSNEKIKQNISLNFGNKNAKFHKMKVLGQETKQIQELTTLDNQILSSHKKKGITLEQYLEKAADHGVSHLNDKNFLLNQGEDCIRYFQINVDMPFKEKGEMLMILSNGQIIYIPKIIMEVGIKVNQFKFTFDRSEQLLYALAIEDCIGSNSYIISKNRKKDTTDWTEFQTDRKEEKKDIIENGAVLKVTTNSFFDPVEMEGLKEKEI